MQPLSTTNYCNYSATPHRLLLQLRLLLLLLQLLLVKSGVSVEAKLNDLDIKLSDIDAAIVYHKLLQLHFNILRSKGQGTRSQWGQICPKLHFFGGCIIVDGVVMIIYRVRQKIVAP